MIKFLLKIWPAFLPITIYFMWVLVISKIIKKLFRKKEVIVGEYQVVGEARTDNSDKVKAIPISSFSLQNRYFVIIIYLSLISAIITLIFSAFYH